MGLSDLLPPVLLEIRAKATELHAELGKVKTELEDAAKKGEETGGRLNTAFSHTAAYGQTLTKGAIGIAGAIGGFAVEAATSAEVVDAKLRTAIQNAGGSMEEFDPKITKVDDSLRKYGFTNEQTNTALATLTTATKDPQKALDAMSVSADLARAKNIDLNTASLLVAKAMEGQTRPLKALGIDLPIAAGNALAVKNAQDALAKAQDGVNQVLAKYPDAAKAGAAGHAQYEAATQKVTDAQKKLSDAQSAGGQIMDALKSRVQGAGDAYGKTLRGQLDSAKAGVDNMGESLGKMLIPWINKAIQAGVALFGFLQSHEWILDAIGFAIGVTMVIGIGKWIYSFGKATAETISKFSDWLSHATSMVTGVTQRMDSLASSSELSAEKQVAAQKEVQAAETETEAVTNSKLGSIGSMLSNSAGKFADWAKSIVSRNTEVTTNAETSAEAQVVAQDTVQVAEEETAAVSRITGVAVSTALGPIGLAISAIITIVMLLQGHWKDVWDAITGVASWVWDHVLKPFFGWIGDAIGTVIGAIKDAIDWFTSLFGAANNAESASQKAIDAAARVPSGAAAAGSLGGLVGNLGYVVHKAMGGWIPGSPGTPVPAVMHGSEYVLSVDMLNGRQPVDPKVLAALGGQQSDPSAAAFMGGGGGTATSVGGGVTVIAQTNASPSQIASSVGWELRKRAA